MGAVAAGLWALQQSEYYDSYSYNQQHHARMYNQQGYGQLVRDGWDDARQSGHGPPR